MLLRILTKDDVKEEYQNVVSDLVLCPVLNRHQVLLMCFACSRLSTCKIPEQKGISELAVEDVVHDVDFFRKETFTRKQELGGTKPKKRTVRRKKTFDQKDQDNVKEVKKMRGEKKKAIMAYLETHPNASVGEIRKACDVSAMYAKKVLSLFKSKTEVQNSNPPQD